MTIFRGPKEGTLPDGSVIATQSDIGEALTAAQEAQAAAEAAQAAADATLDNFDARYLGAKSSDPTEDNDGNALIDGALYYNTDDQMTRVYDLSEGTWFNLKPTSTEQTNINALAPFASQVGTVGDNITDVQTVSTDITDVNTTATNIADVNTVSTSITDVNTVSSISSDVTTVAGISPDVEVVSGIDSDVTTVSSIQSDIAAVIADQADIGTVATNITSVNTVAGIDSSVTDVSQSSDAVDIIATDLAGAGFDYDLGTITAPTDGVLGTPDGYLISVYNIRSEIETVDGISTDVTTLAPISSNITTVAGVSSDVTTVSGVAAEVTTVADISTDVTAVSSISSDVTNVSDAIDGDPAGASLVSYDNATSGLTATDVQDAVDELESEKASLAGGNTFTGTQDVTGDVNIDGTVDCGTIV